MADTKQKYQRGVVVELDFALLDGAELLFNVAKKYLAEIGIDLTLKLEAKHLVGGNYHGGMTELFSVTGNRHEPAKAARELAEAFRNAVTEKIPAAVTQGFKDFVNALVAKDIKVVVATRGDVEVLKTALEGVNPELCVPYQETSTTYGNCKWDAWRRACSPNGLHEMLTVAITGSGFGVKSALVAGLSAIGVVHPHTAYQDFGGADAVVEAIDASLAKTVLRMLHMD